MPRPVMRGVRATIPSDDHHKHAEGDLDDLHLELSPSVGTIMSIPLVIGSSCILITVSAPQEPAQDQCKEGRGLT